MPVVGVEASVHVQSREMHDGETESDTVQHRRLEDAQVRSIAALAIGNKMCQQSQDENPVLNVDMVSDAGADAGAGAFAFVVVGAHGGCSLLSAGSIYLVVVAGGANPKDSFCGKGAAPRPKWPDSCSAVHVVSPAK